MQSLAHIHAVQQKSERKWRRENPKAYLVKLAKARARRKGMLFDLSADDFEIPVRCPALGLVLRQNRRAVADSSPTLDCIIPSRGYVRGNVVVISAKANRIKNNASLAEIRAVVRWFETL